MKVYYVYIVRCNDKNLYTGVTNNIERRVSEHNSGKLKSAYTYSRRPVKLIFYQEFNDPEQAIGFEKKIKKWSRLKKEALINGDYNALHVLSKCKNDSHHKFKLLDKK